MLCFFRPRVGLCRVSACAMVTSRILQIDIGPQKNTPVLLMRQWMSANAPFTQWHWEICRWTGSVVNNDNRYSFLAHVRSGWAKSHETEARPILLQIHEKEPLMRRQIPPRLVIGAAITGLVLGGCTSTAPISTSDPSKRIRAEYEQKIKVKDSEIDSLKSSLTDANRISK